MKEKIILGLKWSAFVYILLMLIGSLVTSAIVSAIAFIITGLILFPPLKETINSKLPFMANRGVKATVVILIFLVGGFNLSNADKANKTDTTKSVANTTKDQSETKSVSNEPTDPHAELRAQLKREVKSFDDGINVSSYRGEISSLQIEIALFLLWADISEKALATDDQDILSMGRELYRKVQNLQVSEFPTLRKEYGKLAAKELWVEDITVTTSGSGHSTINFVGGIFAANRNIQAFQEQMQDILTQFRYKQVTYRWYKGASDYQYYNLSTPKDGDVLSTL